MGRDQWETPILEPITDADARADRADVSMQNGFPNGPSGPV